MFTVYSSNKLSSLAEMLAHFQKISPNPNPFEKETILVQSTGMAQWLQMYLANAEGIAANYEFPFPTSFLWQQYRLLFPELPKENIFERKLTTWRLMRLIPQHLTQPECHILKQYLSDEDSQSYSLKLFQLAGKIADLFDQYLVYRPHWLTHWESGETHVIFNEIIQQYPNNDIISNNIQEHLNWQGLLWNALISDIKQNVDEHIFNTSHRAYLQEKYFNKLDHLTESERHKLPKRIFIFGISSLPATQLIVLKKLSEHCDIHLFFLNPSEMYWGDNVEDSVLAKLALKQPLLQEDLDTLMQEQGNQLLTMWGKQGKEFLAQLVELELHHIEAFEPYEKNTNLNKIKNAILASNNQFSLDLDESDRSVQIHSCHNEMREIEVLHNQLLYLFEQDSTLSPKDIIVMSPDIDKYAPYINAVFSRFEKGDSRFIPFTISDQKIATINPIISSFMTLLSLKESQFEAETLLDLLDIVAIREKFNLNENDLYYLRHWVKNSGIRSQHFIQQEKWENYNSWENGLNRLLLGSSLKAENGIWQETVGFNESYGLNAILVGYLSQFITKLSDWFEFIQNTHTIEEWKFTLNHIINAFYMDSSENADAILLLNNSIEAIAQMAQEANYTEQIHIEILQLLFNEYLANQQNHLNFLVGKVNFCTLLPMRAIPFKVVCLLGMNEADFPRSPSINHFDLMQYDHKKGDRARRDDDRYLFLEALLAAQNIFYISYIGQSIVNNKEKLPSILVSQLLDYLCEHIAPENADIFLTQIIEKHPISIFSQNNFKPNSISYNSEWLNIIRTTFEASNFLETPLEQLDELPNEIELEDLIRFVQNPVKFFFNKRLGVYFDHKNEQIETSELFIPSHLDNYKFKKDLLLKEETELADFFKQEKLKGNLPLAHFAEVYTAELHQIAMMFRNELSSYLGNNEVLEIVQHFSVGNKKIRLVGNISSLFNNEIILWKVSKLKDKDIIRFWLYYLSASLQKDNLAFKYIYLDKGKDKEKNKEKIHTLSFSPLEKETIVKQLTQYIADYLASYHKINYVITENISSYFKKLNEIEKNTTDNNEKPNEEPNEESKIKTLSEKALYAMLASHNRKNDYLNRVLQQSKNIDYEQIYNNTLSWFEEMNKSQLKIK